MIYPDVAPQARSPPTSRPQMLESRQLNETTSNVLGEKYRQHRSTAVYESSIRLTWVRRLVTCFSYLLLFTDVPRTGLGVTNLHEKYVQLEPNIFISFGPYWYSMTQIHSNETTNEASSISGHKVWTYKYDTTSIGLRAFGEFFHLHTFPDCLFYRSDCQSDFLSSTSVFQLLDSLVEAVANQPQSRQAEAKRTAGTSVIPTAITLRTRYMWFDQLHHHLLPLFFNKPIWRLHQALYYPTALSAGLLPFKTSLCSVSNPVRPYSCDERWVNFRHGCNDGDSGTATCQVEMEYLWTHILERQAALQSIYPEHQIDLTIVESIDDSTFNRGGLAYIGRRKADIVTISRVRKCDPNMSSRDSCETVFIQDYRYETEVFNTDVVNWYWVIAVLRCFGQGYMHLRCIMLFFACYKISSITTENNSSDTKFMISKSYRIFLKRLRTATSTFFRIPCQVVIYGSWFPVSCYVIAHVIDSPVTYEMVIHKINSTEGILHVSFRDFITIATVRMRNVWFVALVVHFFTYLTSQRPHWVASATGVFGVREFSITFASAVTIFAQYRSTKFRDTRILAINQIVDGSHGSMALKQFSYCSNGGGNELWEGVLLDVKCIICVIIGLMLLTVSFHLMVVVGEWVRHRWRGSPHRNRQHAAAVQQKQSTLFLDTTLAPYTCGILWSASSLSVAWDGAVGFAHEKRNSIPVPHPPISSSWKTKMWVLLTPRNRKVTQAARNSHYITSHAETTDVFSSLRKTMSDSSTVAINTISTAIPVHRLSTRINSISTATGSIKHNRRILPSFVVLQGEGEILQWNLERILERRSEVASFVVLMNLTLLTDIWTFVRLRYFADQEIYWLQSKRTKQIVLMPKEIVERGFQTNTWVAWDEFDVVLVQNTQEIHWIDLLYCG